MSATKTQHEQIYANRQEKVNRKENIFRRRNDKKPTIYSLPCIYKNERKQKSKNAHEILQRRKSKGEKLARAHAKRVILVVSE